MGRTIFRAWDKLRKRLLGVGYACDVCGRELFHYPDPRVCEDCESKLPFVKMPCERCGREKRAAGLCLDCKSAPPAFTRGVSVWTYRAESAMLVNRVKRGDAKLAVYLGRKMAEALITAKVEGSTEEVLLLPVPTSGKARRTRGFNQAERLAEGVCERLLAEGWKVETDFSLLQKKRETKPQKQMTRKEREENVQGAYFVGDRTRCKDRTVVLIDDVMTTGATGNEIAARLKKAGAKRVYFLTAASVAERK